MNVGVLLSLSIWFAAFTFIWDKSDAKNILIKTIFFGISVWSVYLLYNNQFNNVAFIIAVTLFSTYMNFMWKMTGVANVLIKITFAIIVYYGVIIIFSKHLI